MAAAFCLGGVCLWGSGAAAPTEAMAMTMTMAVEEKEQAVMAEDLTRIILDVKTQLKINSDYWNDFSYNSYNYGNGVNWSLNWYPQEDQRYRLNVQTDADGNILQYSYNCPEERAEWAKIRRAEAEKTAEQFLKQIARGYADTMRLVEEQSLYQNRSYFTFVYQQYHQDIPVVNGTVTINIDRQTGSVRSCSVSSGVNFTNKGWADKSQAISLAMAEKAMVEELGVAMEYRSYYDSDKKTHQIYPVYHVTKGNLVLDALTGKGIDRNAGAEEEYRKENMVFNSSMSADMEEAAGLSPQELAVVEQTANLISANKAADILRQAAKMQGYGELHSSRLNTSYYDEEQYIWSVDLQQEKPQMSLGGAVEAEKGRILNFYQYRHVEQEEKIYSKQEADSVVKAFFAEQAATEIAQCLLTETEAGNEEYPRYSYSYYRQVNGIPFKDNGVYVTYEGKGGYINNYRLTWWEDAEFPSIAAAKTPQQIAADMVKEADFALQYQKTKDGYRLIYDFRDMSAMQFDPFSGKRVNWRGVEYVEEVLPIYHWLGSENEQAVWLHENGVYLDKEELNNAAMVTQEEFAQLLYRSLYPYSTADNMYEELAQRGIISEHEKKPTTYVTRQQAAQYVVRMLGYGDLLAYPELFNYPYRDNCDELYRGAVAISGTLSLLEADADGNFAAEQNITQGETFELIVRTIKQK